MTSVASEPPDRLASAGITAAVTALMHSISLSKAVCVAADLKVADFLACGPLTVGELARATRTHARSLRRLLRALACVGLCAETAEDVFALTTSGALLRTDTPDSLRSWILWLGKHQWTVWDDLLHSVRTGESSRKCAFGVDGFEHLERDQEAAAVFNHAMAEMTRLVAGEVVRVCDFAGTQRFVDVGGGLGVLAVAILQASPTARGIIFDRPHAIDGARSFLSNAGLTERCDVIAGDFFESVPEGCDSYLLKSVIHDWDDEQSVVILRNCRRAMAKDGKVLLIERIMPPRLGSSTLDRAIVYSDLTMLVGPGGKERTKAELATLLDSAGLVLTNIVGTMMDYSVLEGRPR